MVHMQHRPTDISMMRPQDKIEVNGKNAHPLYRFLKAGTKSGDLEVSGSNTVCRRCPYTWQHANLLHALCVRANCAVDLPLEQGIFIHLAAQI
jgi:hypothetical protein